MKVFMPDDLHELEVSDYTPGEPICIAVGIPERDKGIMVVVMAVNQQEYGGDDSSFLTAELLLLGGPERHIYLFQSVKIGSEFRWCCVDLTAGKSDTDFVKRNVFFWKHLNENVEGYDQTMADVNAEYESFARKQRIKNAKPKLKYVRGSSKKNRRK